MAEWTGFLAAQAFNAAAAAVAHVPSWLTRIPRDTVWFRRLVLLECVMPVPGAIASMVCIHAPCRLLSEQPAQHLRYMILKLFFSLVLNPFTSLLLPTLQISFSSELLETLCMLMDVFISVGIDDLPVTHWIVSHVWRKSSTSDREGVDVNTDGHGFLLLDTVTCGMNKQRGQDRMPEQ